MNERIQKRGKQGRKRQLQVDPVLPRTSRVVQHAPEPG